MAGTVQSDGLNIEYGTLATSGTVRIDNAGRLYVLNIQNSGVISFLNGTNGTSGSGAQGINVRHVYAGTTYASSTAGAGEIESLNGFKVAGTTVIDSGRIVNATRIRNGTSGELMLGNFNGTNTDQWPLIGFFSGTDGTTGTWDEGIIKGSSSRGVFSKAHLGIHFDDDRSFAFHTSGWDTEMEINGDGRIYQKGPVGIGLTPLANSTKLQVHTTTDGGPTMSITSSNPGSWAASLAVGATDAAHTLVDGNDRPMIIIDGAYPVLNINHTITTNSNHGPTIQFTHEGYNSNRQWVIGTDGQGDRMDFGVSGGSAGTNSDKNPHNGIAGYQGVTIMRLFDNGVMVGDTGVYTNELTEPSAKLDVRGDAYITDELSINYTSAPNKSKFHVSGGKMSIVSNDHSYGQLQLGRTNAGEVSIGFMNTVTESTIGADSPTATYKWAAGLSVYGVGSNVWGIGNAASSDIFRLTSGGTLQLDQGIQTYGGDTTPAGTSFANTLAATTSDSRVVNFDGNGHNPSTWYSNGNTAHAAIDCPNGEMLLYVNDTGGTWRNVMSLSASGINNNGYAFNGSGGLTITGSVNVSNKYHLFGASNGWDTVGSQTNVHFQGHPQFWIGAGNGTWFTGTANSRSATSGLSADGGSAHDLLLTTMQGTSAYDRGITFGATNSASNYTSSGWRLGKWHASTAQAYSKLVVDGGLFVKGGYTDEFEYYGDDYSTYYNDQAGGTHWTGDSGSGWNTPSATFSSAIQIQSGNNGTNSRKPAIQFHQYGYGGPIIEYDGPNQVMTVGETGTTNRLDWVQFSTHGQGTGNVVRVNYDQIHSVGSALHIQHTTAQDVHMCTGSGGNVGIGITGPSSKLTVEGNCELRDGVRFRRDLGADTGISHYNNTYYNWQEYMASAGVTGCGPNGNLTAPSGLSEVTSWALRSRMEGVSSYGWLWETGGSGAGGATATNGVKMELAATTGNLRVAANIIAYASDGRLKTNVKPIENAIDKVKQIRGVEYDWVDDIVDHYGFHPTKKHEVGVIAQEVEKVLPEVVTTAPFNGNYVQKFPEKEDPNFLTVNYDRIVPLLIEAIKDQQKEIDELKSLINRIVETKGE